MKRLIVIGTALVLLTGCTPAPQGVPESIYVDLVHENIPEVASATTEQLRSMGKNICTIVEEGSWGLAVKTVTDNNMDAYNAGQFINFAVNTYCPEQVSKLPG